MSQFIEPKTLDEATARRAKLVARKNEAQAWLSDRNTKGFRGQRLSAHEYHRLRAETVAEVSQCDTELAALKASISRLSNVVKEESRKWDVFSDGTDRKQRVSDSLAGLFDYISFLERELALAQSENERLKAGAPEPAPIGF